MQKIEPLKIQQPKSEPKQIKSEPIKQEIVPIKIPQEVVVVVTKITEPKQVIKEEVKIDNTPIKQKFFAELKQKINSNKFYPHNARRRGIEGVVEVKFEILSSGQAGAINIISGNQIFFQSAKEAIESSFPMTIPAQIKDNLGFVTVSLEYRLL